MDDEAAGEELGPDCCEMGGNHRRSPRPKTAAQDL